MTPNVNFHLAEMVLFSTLPEGAKKKHYSLPLAEANLDHGLANLIYFFLSATEAERQEGIKWYASTFFETVELAKLYHLPVDQVIDVIAALSPQLRWSENIYSAEVVIRYFLAGSFVPSYTEYLSGAKKLLELSQGINLPIDANVTGINKLKALWLLQGQKWALHGPKVEAFADNIHRFEDSNRVTVDSHAISAWFGCVVPQSVTVTPSFMAIIEADYRKLAALFGVSPLEGQAIVWIVKRRMSGADIRKGQDKKLDPWIDPAR